MKPLIALLLLLSSLATAEITWKRTQLHGDFYSEGAGMGDINGDGKPDIVAGPYWWAGPEFKERHSYYEPKVFSVNGYSDNFFAYVHDFDADQKNDILILGFPGKEARVYLNPGKQAEDKPWPTHIVADVVDNESPVFTDITGDGKPEIVCSTGGKFGWFAPNWEKPTEKWPFVAVTTEMGVAKFTHGLGVGDVNGDGHMDLLEARRWWECPTENGQRKTSDFYQHNFGVSIGGGAQMFAYDFDGNGTNDIFTALAAHRYGVAVFLQTKPQALTLKGTNTYQPGNITATTEVIKEVAPANWTRIMLASEQPQDNDYGIVFSQPHAAHLADINGDGVKDIVTGKRYWAHNGHDPDEHGHRVIYWYETKRDGKGGVDFVPHLVDAQSGVGVDVQVGDLNGDKLPDILVANKAGVFVHTQVRNQQSEIKDQKLYGPALKPQKLYAHGQSPQDALKNLQLPTGFKAELIAAEPDVVQPIAFTFDERGRIWVVEGNSYPQPREVGKGQDRIKILEDKDGDGTFETKKVFCEGINLASGIELGFGGVWVGAAPYLMFIPDKDRNDQPDPSDPTDQRQKVPGLNFTAYALLDGWGTQDTHETLNSFIWGPDGWLYGCHGVFTHSRVGKPGTPDEQRQPINAGVWRYHPVRHEFEVFAHGTSNPWGLDYDQHGEWFVTACVIPHLYHIVPGGRYQRQAGQHFNPYTYEDIKTIADHAHYAGSLRPDINFDKTTGAGFANNDTNALGGGHAHCGLAIYQSNQFPPTYRNQLLFGNLHGHRLVANYTYPHGSSYIGKHAADFMRSNDMHFIPVTQKVGPDGALYVSDWSDQQICHRGSGAVENWDRSNGRIYRISYDGWKPWKGDLAKESDEALVKLAVQTENEWESRMARRVLMERSSSPDFQYELRLGSKLQWWITFSDKMWTHVGPRSASDAEAIKWLQLHHALGWDTLCGGEFYESFKDGPVRAIAIRLMTSDWSAAKPSRRFLTREEWTKQQKASQTPRAPTSPSGLLPPETSEPDKATYQRLLSEATKMPPPVEVLDDFSEEIATEVAPVVRREFASLLQKLPLDARPIVATALLSHGEDKDDPMIPLLIWYGIEPLVGADPKVALELAKASKMPKVTGFIYRRMAADDAGRMGLLRLAVETPDAGLKLDLLNAVLQAARSGHKLARPDGWDALSQKVASASAESENAAKTAATFQELEAFMGIESTLAMYRKTLGSAGAPSRGAALEILTQVRDAATVPLLQGMLSEPSSTLRMRAIQALSSFNDPATPAALLKQFPSFSPAEQSAAISTLATSLAGAKAMLSAVKEKSISGSHLSPFLARQLSTLKDPAVDALLKETFGDLNAPKADLTAQKAKFKAMLPTDALAAADKAKGKIIFSAICGQCHQLLGEGHAVGPDLTGSNRANLDYLLDNVLDPNALIGKAYQLNLFTLKDGRTASGILKEETPAGYRIVLPGGLEQTLTKAEVKEHSLSKVSTMPEGLFAALPQEQLQQLVAYLQSDAGNRNGAASPAPGKTGAQPLAVPGALEAESLKVTATGGQARTQGMKGFGNKWSSGQQLWWIGAKPGDSLTLTLPVAKAGRYTLSAALTQARDYGIIHVALDGKSIVKDWDGFHTPQVTTTGALNWGKHELTAGDHTLTFSIVGAHPDAVKSYMVGVDYLQLVMEK